MGTRNCAAPALSTGGSRPTFGVRGERARPAQSLIDSRFDIESCGVGFVATLDNQPSHDILTKALTALARNASLDLQRTSLAVTGLAKRELASRIKNSRNARETLVQLTPRGHAVFNAIIENWLNKELVAGLSAAEQAAAGEIMRRLVLRAGHILERDDKGYI